VPINKANEAFKDYKILVKYKCMGNELRLRAKLYSSDPYVSPYLEEYILKTKAVF
jgi:hypothetical protein